MLRNILKMYRNGGGVCAVRGCAGPSPCAEPEEDQLGVEAGGSQGSGEGRTVRRRQGARHDRRHLRRPGQVGPARLGRIMLCLEVLRTCTISL